MELKPLYDDYALECQCALNTMISVAQNLQLQMRRTYQRVIISEIHHRIKDYDSTIDKCHRKGYDTTLDSIRQNIHDIAGLRIITLFRDDSYRVMQEIQGQDIEIIEVIDYIKNRKANGYTGLHLVVRIPINFEGHTKFVCVEVQIRTVLEHGWASMDHVINYKQDKPDPDAKEAFLQLANYNDRFEKEAIRIRDRNHCDTTA